MEDICKQGAIHLIPRPDPRTPPKNRGLMFARILWEKGRLWPFVADRLHQQWLRLRGRS